MAYHCFRGLLVPDTKVLLSKAVEARAQPDGNAAQLPHSLGHLSLDAAAGDGGSPWPEPCCIA